MINNFFASLLGLNLYVYGLGVFISLLIFLFLFWQKLHKTALNEEKMVDSLLASAALALVVSRISYILFNLSIFKDSFLKGFLIINYPGVDAVFFWLTFGVYWLGYSFKKKITIKQIGSLLLVPTIASSITIGFFSIIKEPSIYSLLLLLVPSVLVGVYFAIGKLLKQAIGRDYPLGLLALFLSVFNFVVDFFKDNRVYFAGQKILSLQQALCFLIVLVVTIYFLKGRKKTKK